MIGKNAQENATKLVWMSLMWLGAKYAICSQLEHWINIGMVALQCVWSNCKSLSHFSQSINKWWAVYLNAKQDINPLLSYTECPLECAVTDKCHKFQLRFIWPNCFSAHILFQTVDVNTKQFQFCVCKCVCVSVMSAYIPFRSSYPSPLRSVSFYKNQTKNK